jgi:hypothetical protein
MHLSNTLHIDVLVAFLLAAGCRDKTHERGASDDPKPPPIEDTSFRRQPADRIVAIGDLHGDMRATDAALRLAGALGADGHWAGGKLVVVQTGDQLDRGDDEPEILDLLDRLASEASAAGGALYTLNGNHELMNIQGDFRYVTPDGFRDFAATPPDGLHEREILSYPPGKRGRAAALLSGESVAKRLAEHPVVIQVGDNVFVHGGLLERHLRRGLGRINREVRSFMRAPSGEGAPRIVTDEQGPLWLRIYSDGIPSASACKELASVLEHLSAKRLVVGHTVQEQGINSACQGKVWRVDVGLSRSYGGSPSVLEITGDKTRVLQGALPTPPASVSSSASTSTVR